MGHIRKMAEKRQIDLTNNGAKHRPNIHFNASSNEITLEFADLESLSDHPQNQPIYQIVMSPELAKSIGELLINSVAEWEATADTTLPSDDPIWDEIDQLLTKIWSENDVVDPAVDDAWLDETRSSWNERLEDMSDESDTRE